MTPLSPVLFNLVLDGALREVSQVWDRRGYGTDIGRPVRGCRLTHIAFADDQTLVARSWITLKRMILKLRESLLLRGLALHPSKCKVQTNNNEHTQRGPVQLSDDFAIQILQTDECLELLGTSLSLTDPTGAEIDHRIATGWRKFWGMQKLLLNHSFSVKQRLRMFNSTITETVLWATESWAPRAEELRRLRSTMNAMLRKIVGAVPIGEMLWVDWIQIVTERARRRAREAGVRDWVVLHLQRKWRWASTLMSHSEDEWTRRVTEWRDSMWQEAADNFGVARPMRPLRRRWMRFEDVLRRFCRVHNIEAWQCAATDKEDWADHSKAFVQWADSTWTHREVEASSDPSF